MPMGMMVRIGMEIELREVGLVGVCGLTAEHWKERVRSQQTEGVGIKVMIAWEVVAGAGVSQFTRTLTILQESFSPLVAMGR